MSTVMHPVPDLPAPGLLGMAERGLLPDAAIRFGIRRLCEQRLREEHEGGHDVAKPQLLVVYRREPRDDRAWRVPQPR